MSDKGKDKDTVKDEEIQGTDGADIFEKKVFGKEWDEKVAKLKASNVSKYPNEDKQLYEIRNTDNVYLRNIIGGVLDVLNNKLKYTQVWSEDDIETVYVPFFYNLGMNDERLIQDNFMFFQNVCDWPNKIDGNFDSFPRGIITLNSTAIEATSICNRFVLGEYTKKEDDVYNTYVAYLYALPIKMEFTADIYCDTHITMLKIEQAIRETFYKNNTFFVMFKGMRLRCRLGISDSTTMVAPITHKMNTDFGENSLPKLSFTFTVASYHPIFDETTEVSADSYIKEIAYDVSFLGEDNRPTIGKRNSDNSIYTPLNYIGGGRTNELSFTDETKAISGNIYSADQTITLTWDYFKDDGDMRSIIINAIDNETGELTLLQNIKNHTYLDWCIADNFHSDVQQYFEIAYKDPNFPIHVYTLPKLAIVPDPKTKYITAKSFKIVDRGYILEPRDCQIPFEVIYNKKAYNGLVNIKDGCVFEPMLVVFNHKVKFKEKMKVHNITLTIVDAEDTENNDEILDITIV